MALCSVVAHASRLLSVAAGGATARLLLGRLTGGPVRVLRGGERSSQSLADVSKSNLLFTVGPAGFPQDCDSYFDPRTGTGQERKSTGAGMNQSI